MILVQSILQNEDIGKPQIKTSSPFCKSFQMHFKKSIEHGLFSSKYFQFQPFADTTFYKHKLLQTQSLQTQYRSFINQQFIDIFQTNFLLTFYRLTFYRHLEQLHLISPLAPFYSCLNRKGNVIMVYCNTVMSYI